MTRNVTLPNLFAALPFKPGTTLAMEVRADGSVVLFDASNPPEPTVDASVDLDIKAAYEKGIFTCASEAIELLAAKTDGNKSIRPFAMNAYTGVPMKLPGFHRMVVVDLTGMRLAAKKIPALRNHDPERIVAHYEDIEISERRIRASGLMSGVGIHAQEVRDLADNGFPWQGSIGATAERMEYVEAGASAKVNGRNWDGPLLVARQSTLREISFVPLGADPSTSATVAGGES
jgi:hypothetical protein